MGTMMISNETFKIFVEIPDYSMLHIQRLGMNGADLQLYKFRNSVILSQSHIGDRDYTTNGPFTRNVREFVMDATVVQTIFKSGCGFARVQPVEV